MLPFNPGMGFEHLSPEHYAVKLAHQESRLMSAAEVEEHVRQHSMLVEYRAYFEAVWALYEPYYATAYLGK